MSACRNPEYRSRIELLPKAEEPPYWLSLYKGNILYSTTGHVSYGEAIKHALLWVALKGQARHYVVMHEADGFRIMETTHTVTQKCLWPGCRHRQGFSYYVLDRADIRARRLRHRRWHQSRFRDPRLAWFLQIVFIALVIFIIATIKG